ncbi:hypothetical protein ACFQ3S_12680 [Mucilaginibacter terrae]|uniref:hypothetical protein n=1 Tax=Mucilaginibacter terrae TaxID=1955052 RepID=UPI003635BC39
METPVKHYKFINSRTENVIYYYTVEGNLNPEQIKEKLNIIKAQVAVTNGVFLDTVYWEEIKDED